MLNGCNNSSNLTQSSNQAPIQPSITQETQVEDETTYAPLDNDIPLKIIDVLVVVSKNDKDNFNGKNETKIDHSISVTNKIYRNSGLNVKFNIKKIQTYDLDSHKTSSDTLHDIYKDKNITMIKNTTKSDLVLIYRSYVDDGYCGIAYVNSVLNKDIGYAHMALDCPSSTTAHEIGHSMGLTHSEHNTNLKGVFDYARGYGVEGEFVTTMGYKSTYHTKIRVFNYSDPKIECHGHTCGIDTDLDHGANAVEALRYSTNIVSNFN